MENVPRATVNRAVGPASASELLVGDRIKALEYRIGALEERATLSKDFMEIVAKMSGFLGSNFRDQLTAILRRWPKSLSAANVAVTCRAENRQIVVVIPGRPPQVKKPILGTSTSLGESNKTFGRWRPRTTDKVKSDVYNLHTTTSKGVRNVHVASPKIGYSPFISRLCRLSTTTAQNVHRLASR